MTFFAALAHYFYPRYSNNHKAKLIHTSSLFLVSLVLVTYQVLLNTFPIVGVNILGYAANISSDEIIRLTNEKRTQNGAGSLRYNPLLARAASAKGAHMLQYDYWAHIAPDGTEPWKFFTDVGYKYRYAGENLARDFTNPTSVVDAWMASQTHKDNLLSPKYTEIGVAVVEGDLAGVDTTIVVQLFGTPLLDTVQQAPVVQAKPPATATPKPAFTPTNTPAATPEGIPVVISPLPSPAQEEAETISTLPPAEEEAGAVTRLVSPFQSTRGISIATTALLLIVLIIDGLVVARKRLSRVGGRTIAHIAFFGMILALALIAEAGRIL